MTGRTVTVIAPGPLATIQDHGRAGLGHLGIGQSGAADLPSLQRANRLVGNEDRAAAIEMTLGGLRLRLDADAVVAVTGAPCEVLVDGSPVGFGAALRLCVGAEIRCRTPRTGVRSYLAVDGGFGVATILGSRSTDTLSGLGPPPLARGMSLPLGPPPGSPPPSHLDLLADGPVVDTALTLIPGPREEWFAPAAVALLYDTQ